MSLVELTISVGILTLVALSSAYVLQGFTKSHVNAERMAQVVDEGLNIRNALKSHATGALCTDILSLDSGSYNPSDQNPVTISLQGTNYTSMFELSSSFRFNKIYLANSVLVGSTDDNKAYSTTIYAEASQVTNGAWIELPRRSLGSISILIDNATGALLDCNLSAMAVNSQAVCESVTGMIWVPNTEECLQALETEADGTVVDCAGGFYKTPDGRCLPEKSDCNYTQTLPRQIANGTIQAVCDDIPPTLYAVTNDPLHTNVKPNPKYDTGGNMNPSPPPQKCTCGNSEIDSGKHCVKSLPINGGTLDFEGDCSVTVHLCTNGNMPKVRSYTEEESDYCDSSYDRSLHPATCSTNHTNCYW